MPNVLKKFIFSFLAFLVVFLSFAPNFLKVYADPALSCTSQSGHCAFSGTCANGAPISSNDCNTIGFKCCPNNAAPTCASQNAHCALTGTCANGNPLNSSDCNTIGFKCCPNTAVIPPPPPAPAAPTGSWYNQDFGQWYGKVYDSSNPSEIFGERYTAAQVQWVIYSLFSFILSVPLGNSTTSQQAVACFLTGAGDVNSCIAPLQGLIKTSSNSFSPLANNVNSPQQNIFQLVFADRSFSGISYIKNRVQKLRLVPEVHAQTVGFGFSALEPIQKIWSGFRDIAFGLFVIVAVVFAFMIMFRVKISPQVVISVQSAIPKIIMALILVTFSYAIAGFLIDLMYVVIGLISLATAPMFTIFGFSPQPSNIFNFLTLGQPIGLGVQTGVILLLSLYVFSFFLSFLILIIANFGVGNISISFGSIAIILSIILLVVMVVVALWFCIKILWSLLKAFVNIILLTIFAPLQLVVGTLIPNFGFGSWVKNYISNLSTFVVTGTLFLFSFYFLYEGVSIGMGQLSKGINPISALLGLGTIIIPPVGDKSSWPPLLGTGNAGWTGLLFLGVSFVLFTMIPKAAEVVQAFLSGKPFAYGSAIGEAFGPIKMAGSAGLGYGFGKYEESRIDAAKRAGNVYEPAAITQALRTLGIIRK